MDSMTASTRRALQLSRPESGSSSRSTLGRVRHSAARASRRFSPPERPLTRSSPTLAWTTSSSWNARMRRWTSERRRAWGCSGRRSRAQNIRCSSTVDVDGSTTSWDTKPTICWSCSFLTTSALTSIRPETRLSNRNDLPARICRRVLFPAPDGPSNATGDPIPGLAPKGSEPLIFRKTMRVWPL
eukprot:scaffold2437_cov395-Prasinococcus_capsulatus_cf.AAC.10